MLAMSFSLHRIADRKPSCAIALFIETKTIFCRPQDGKKMS